MNTNNRLQNYIASRITVESGTALDRKHIYLLPNKNGLLFIISCALMLLLGVNYENNLVLLIGIFGLSVLITSLFLTYKNLHGLSITILEPTYEIFAEKAIPINIYIENNHNQVSKNLHFISNNGPDLFLTNVDPKHNTAFILSAHQRGYQTIPRLKLTSNYPLGLFTAFSYIKNDISILVLPKPICTDYTLTKNLLGYHHNSNMQSAVSSSSFVRGHDEISGLKPYRPGDSINLIAWKQLAKGRGLMLKDFSADLSMPQYLTVQSIKSSVREEQISMLTYACIDICNQGLCFGFEFEGNQLLPNSGNIHRQKILNILATS